MLVPMYEAPTGLRPAFVNVYDDAVDLSVALTPEQREQLSQHELTHFPTWLVVVLHFVTLGLFTLIYQGLKLSKVIRAV